MGWRVDRLVSVAEATEWLEGYSDRAAQLFEKLAQEYPDSPWLEKLPQNEDR